MSTTVDRARVLAYRIARQGLNRTSTPVDDELAAGADRIGALRGVAETVVTFR